MTTPNQGIPSSVETALGTGAYEIGGGGTDFGQAVDADIVTQMFRIPNPTQANKLDVLSQVLNMLPPDALGSFSEIVPDWVDGDESDPETAAEKIINTLDPKTTPNAVQEALQETWDAIVGGFLGLFGLTGQTPDDVESAASEVATAANTALYSTETMQGFFNEPRILPAFVGALSDEVSFNRDGVDGTTAPTLGTIVLIPVKITQDRVIDAIKIGCAATTMTNLYIGLYDCDETTGDLAKVLDLGDRKADLDTGYAQQTFELVEPVGLQKGEIYYISVLQVGGTAAAMHRRSLSFNMTDGLFPKHLGSTWATTGVSTLPSTIDDADVLSGTRYWGAVGTAAEPVTTGGAFVSDSFNRANNSSSIGGAWTLRVGSGGILNNRPTSNAFTSLARWTHNTRMLSSSHRVGFRYDPAFSDAMVKGTLRGNGLGPCVELIVSLTSGYARISTVSTYSGSTTTRATVSTSSLAGDWVFEAVGNTYTAYLNGVSTVQWVDSGGAFTVASNSTEVGMYVTEFAATCPLDDLYAQDI